MNTKKAINIVKEQGSKLEMYKNSCKFLHVKPPKNNGLQFWSAVDCLKKQGFKCNYVL